MRFSRARLYLVSGVIAVAGITAGSVLSAVPASAVSSQVVLVNCRGQGVVKPVGYNLGCMPSQEFISGMSWTSWRTNAFGTATLKVNSCNPTCAAGHYVSYPILTVLWGAKARPHHPGQRYFSELTLIFTGKKPSPGPTARTFRLSPTGT